MAKKKIEAVIVDGDELGELLRAVIDEGGATRYAIAQATSIPEAALSRMYNGKASTTISTLAKVAALLDYRVVVRVEKIE